MARWISSSTARTRPIPLVRRALGAGALLADVRQRPALLDAEGLGEVRVRVGIHGQDRAHRRLSQCADQKRGEGRLPDASLPGNGNRKRQGRLSFSTTLGRALVRRDRPAPATQPLGHRRKPGEVRVRQKAGGREPLHVRRVHHQFPVGDPVADSLHLFEQASG